MTLKKLVILAILLWMLLVPVKIVFLNVLNTDNLVIEILLGVVFAVVTMGVVRRLGVLNFLEAMMVAVVWFIINLILDLFVLATTFGLQFFSHWQVWTGYVLSMVVIFFFHKKRHVHIRHELHEKHAAHGKGHGH